jgi:S-adenosylmethionine/arginine decarboxylase-like enzyme
MKINHLHLFIRAECETAPGPCDEELICRKVSSLIRGIGMQVFMEPKAKYLFDAGNEGLTYIAGLETSHTSGHFWDSPDSNIMKYPGGTLFQGDCYTCGCLGTDEIKKVLNFISEYKPYNVAISIFDRSSPDKFGTARFQTEYDIKNQESYSEFLKNLKIKY